MGMKEEHLTELIAAGDGFLHAVFANLRSIGDDGSAIFREGARFEKALDAAKTGRRRSYGTPQRQAEANAALHEDAA